MRHTCDIACRLYRKDRYYFNLRSRENCFYFNLGPLIKPIRSPSSNQTPACHSARSYAESQNLYPTDFTMMDSATSRGMTMNRQTGLFIPES